MATAVYLILVLLAFGGPLAWLVHCGGRWRTAAFILGRLVIAVVVFAGIATAVAQSRTTVCYNGPCSEHAALIWGFLAGLVLGIVTLIAAIAAGMARARGGERPQPEAVRGHPSLRPRRVGCDLLALGALGAGAVVFGNHLGDVQVADPTVDVPLSAALWWWLLVAAVLLVLGRIPLRFGPKTDLIR